MCSIYEDQIFPMKDFYEIEGFDEAYQSPGNGILPEVQSMQRIIEVRYGDRLCDILRSQLTAGVFVWEFAKGDKPPERMTVGTEDIRMNGMFFTRIDRFSVHADIYFLAAVLCEYNGLSVETDQEFRCCMEIDMYEGEPTRICAMDYQVAHAHYRVRKGTALDEFLVPYYDRDKLDDAAEALLWDYAPEMLTEPKAIQARVLADRMGLQVICRPLYQKRKTASILFFCDGELKVQDEEGKYIVEQIPGKTIVLNNYYEDKPGASELAIFHECFHYGEHYLFFRAQRMYNNDITRLAKWKEIEPEKAHVVTMRHMLKKYRSQRRFTTMNPLRNIEWQAKLGSYGMMLPRTMVRTRIQNGLQALRNTSWHAGQKLESICRKLAEEFEAPKYCARYRAISMGYVAAKGALNYVGDKYIAPFAFSLDSCRGAYTFVVPAKEVIREYVQDPQFRELLDKGRYVYVDGHMCLDDERYVVQTASGPTMTKYGNAHVDECCLRFKVNYDINEDETYEYGQLRSDADYNARYLTYDGMTKDMTLLQKMECFMKVIEELPKQANKAIVSHMQRLEITVEQMAERCEVSESSIKRIKSGAKKLFTLDQILIICFALHLPPELSDDLLRRSDNVLLMAPVDDSLEERERYTQHMIYRVLLRSFYLLPIGDIQKKLAQEKQYMLDYMKKAA